MRFPTVGREGLVILLIVVVAAAGVGLERVRGDIEIPAGEGLDSPLFVERAVFCPSAPEGAVATVRLTAGPIDEDPVLIDVEPSDEEPVEIEQEVVTKVFRNPTNAQVISYGRFAAATTSTTYREPVAGSTSSPCSNSASRRWIFPAGSSARGYNEQVVLYNPFPDEAVVRVSFVTPGGMRSKAGLSSVAVPSGGATTVRLNRFVLQQPVLGLDVVAVRGRIVARKTLFSSDDERPTGVGATLGARAGSTEWFFPLGGSGEGVEEKISILNATDERALVTISLVGEGSIEQPADLVEIAIDRHSSKSIPVSKVLGKQDLGGVSAIVRSENGVPVYAERAIWYRTGAFNGFTLELGSPRASASWWLGPAGARADQGSVIVLNVGQEEAIIELDLLTEGGSGPTRLNVSDLRVPAGGRLRIPLTDELSAPGVVLLRSSSPVVAERVGYNEATKDVAALMGIPIE